MDAIKQKAMDSVKSAKFKSVNISLEQAEDKTLDVVATGRFNVNLPGDSEQIIVQVAETFGLGKPRSQSPSS
jgi:hypothetical protein